MEDGPAQVIPLNNNMNDYTYFVFWSDRDRQYIAICPSFPKLSWMENTQEKALQGIKDLVENVIKDMQRSGEPIPPPTEKISDKPISKL